jgi:hypothetical protein
VCDILKTLKCKNFQAWWYTSAIPALRRMKQEDCEFAGSLSYIIHLRPQSETLSQKQNKIKTVSQDLNLVIPSSEMK